jgi:GTPase SAR1 family protein
MLDKIDVDAILSLNEKQYSLSIKETSAYLLEFVRDVTESNEIRLMILGNRGEGKTSFARRFKDLEVQMPKEYESTVGIDFDEIMSGKIITGEKDVNIKIWDFSGDAIDHAAHKFFLSKDRCVYVIVCQTRWDEKPLESSKIEYWLEHIRNFARGEKQSGTKDSIFILINQWDNKVPFVEEDRIRADYKEYELFFHYLNIDKDNQEGGALDKFRREITKYILSINTLIPKSIKEMHEIIKSKFVSENTISVEDIYSIIEKEKAADSNKEDILGILDMCAYCYWFKDISGVDKVVLKPNWITRAVYKIITWVRQSNSNKDASIKKSDFSNALRVNKGDELEFPEDQDKFIFEAMKRFELAFGTNGDTLVIPYCLGGSYPDNEASLSYNPEDSIQIEICINGALDTKDPKFPEGVIPLFIVKNYMLIHKNRNKNPIISRNKAMFYAADRSSRAEIERHNDYRIRITAKGDNVESSFAFATELTRKLKHVLSDLRWRQEPELSFLITQIGGKTRKIEMSMFEEKKTEEITEFLKPEKPELITLIKDAVSELFNRGGINIMEGDINIAVSDSQINNIKNNKESTITTTINNEYKTAKLQELKELISEVKVHLNEVSEEIQDEINELINAVENEARSDKPKIKLLDSYQKSLSEISETIAYGVAGNALYSALCNLVNVIPLLSSILKLPTF